MEQGGPGKTRLTPGWMADISCTSTSHPQLTPKIWVQFSLIQELEGKGKIRMFQEIRTTERLKNRSGTLEFESVKSGENKRQIMKDND